MFITKNYLEDSIYQVGFKLMKLYFIRNETVFVSFNPLEKAVAEIEDCTGSPEIGSVMSQIIPDPDESSDDEGEKCSELKAMLEEYSRDKFHRKGREFNLEKIWSLKIHSGPSDDDPNKSFIALKGVYEGSVLEGLRYLYGCSAKIQIELEFYGLYQTLNLPIQLKTEEMEIRSGPVPFCMDSNIDDPFRSFYARNLIPEKCNGVKGIISFFIPDDVFEKHKAIRTLPSTCKQILDEEIFSNLTIVAGNGNTIKAHKSFLAAQSAVFFAMFKADTGESQESVVEIPEMSENGVRALLKYLYYRDLVSAEANCLVAFELFNAGYKYDIHALEKNMRDFVLKQPGEWYDADVAVKLFLFARNKTPVDEELKFKATMVLKTHAATVKDSPTGQDLFKTDAKAAMELLECALST